MKNESQQNALKVATEERILNEFASKILNEERMEKVVTSRRDNRRLSSYSETLFHCECDDALCTETISMSTEEYEKVHEKTKQFIVVGSHVRLDLEEILATFGNYTLVSKYFPHGPLTK